MEKILIELILTNQCNKRCEYCDLDFKNSFFWRENINKFIKFLKQNKANYKINFFWWEPLLDFENLKYFVENSKEFISYFSIWTNWILLNKEKLNFLQENNVKIYLSIDNISCGKNLDFELLQNFENIIQINFINDPDYLENSIFVFEKIKKYWFKNISFMPVFNIKKWNNVKLWKLKKILDYVNEDWKNLNINYFSYFNWISSEKQFILDTDLNFYSDLDSLLWLQKQYKNIDKKLFEKINFETKIWNLNEEIDLENLLKKHDIKNILNLVFEIPKNSWDLLSYKIIDKLLKNGT